MAAVLPEGLTRHTVIQRQWVEGGADLTIEAEQNHRHRLLDYFYGVGPGTENVTVTIGKTEFFLFPMAKGDCKLVSGIDYARSGKGLLGLLKSIAPDYPLPYAAENEDILIENGGSGSHLAIFEDTVPDDPGNTDLPGGSTSEIYPQITRATHSVAVTVDGWYELDTSYGAKGDIKLKHDKVVPPGKEIVLVALAFGATAATGSVPKWAYILDSKIPIYTENTDGFYVDPVLGNSLRMEIELGVNTPIMPQYVFREGKKIEMQMYADYDDANQITALTEQMILFNWVRPAVAV